MPLGKAGDPSPLDPRPIRFIVKITYDDGWTEVLPCVEAADHTVVSETILRETTRVVTQIIVKELPNGRTN